MAATLPGLGHTNHTISAEPSIVEELGKLGGLATACFTSDDDAL